MGNNLKKGRSLRILRVKFISYIIKINQIDQKAINSFLINQTQNL
jgi:hypothetical protein